MPAPNVPRIENRNDKIEDRNDKIEDCNDNIEDRNDKIQDRNHFFFCLSVPYVMAGKLRQSKSSTDASFKTYDLDVLDKPYTYVILCVNVFLVIRIPLGVNKSVIYLDLRGTIQR
uniref:Uncharacterized protein n=1 Tax=Cacopsylla melanoneura TaxID=428564 RepID=A0A8D8Z230_9HEMI